MGFGLTVRAKRTDQNIGLNDFAERLGVSPAYWSRVEREQENPPRDELVERAAAILGVRMDDLFVEAGRLRRFPASGQRRLRSHEWHR